MQRRKRAEGQEEEEKGIRAGRSLVALDDSHLFSSPSLLSSRAFSG